MKIVFTKMFGTLKGRVETDGEYFYSILELSPSMIIDCRAHTQESAEYDLEQNAKMYSFMNF